MTLQLILNKCFQGEAYVLKKHCPDGSEIKDVSECKKACKHLGIVKTGRFKKDRPCYKGGNGVCNQNIKKPGSKATRICKGA